MAQRSIFWAAPTVGDGASNYTQDDMFTWIKRTFGDGVMRGYANELRVTGASLSVNVLTGAAIVNGAPYESTAPVNLAIPHPTSGTTGHTVALRWDDTANTVRVALVSSPDGISTPPVLTHTPPVWEIRLADVTITTGNVITVSINPDFALQTTRSFFVPVQSATNDTDNVPIPLDFFGASLPDGKDSGAAAQFQVPADFIKDLTIKPVFGGTAGNGNVFSNYQYSSAAINQAYDTNVVTDFGGGAAYPLVAGQRTFTLTVPLPAVKAGDFVIAVATRGGLVAGDTLVGFVSCMGFIVTYTGT